MTAPRRSRTAALAARLARIVLGLFPPSFRRSFGADLVTAVGDRVDDAAVRGGIRAVWTMCRALLDLTGAAMLEWLLPSHASARSTRRATRSGSLMDTLAQDLRFGLRSLVRRPAFAAVAILTLALGIGATTGVFSVVEGVLLAPLPYPEPDGLVMVWAADAEAPTSRGYMSQPDIASARELDVLTGLEGVASGGFTLTGVEHPERVEGARVTGGLLATFGLAPELGRDLRQEENDPGAARVVVVGYAFWKSHLGGRPDVVGTTLDLSEKAYEIVGVAPAGFGFPGGAELWTPYRNDPDGCGRGCHVFRGAVGRLAPGVGLVRAQAELGALAASLSAEFPGSNHGEVFHFERLIDYTVGDVRTGLWIVLGAVGLVLLIVCANVANLLLVRASTRGGEVAVRSALGASRGRLVVQILTESAVLAAVGGAGGVAFAFGLAEVVKRVARGAVPRLEQVGIDWTVLAFSVGLTLLVSLLVGLSPALRLSRGRLAGHLSGAGRSGDTRREGRARSVLLAGEVALSLALLVGAGLLTRSLGRLYGVDMGFDGRQVARFTVNLPSTRYDGLPEILTFFDELEGRLRAIPGVEAVGSAFGAPLTSSSITGGVRVEGRPEPEPGQETEAAVRSVTPGFFEAMGPRLLRGRRIEAGDRRETEAVAVVNATFARENFPGEDVMGKRFDVTAAVGFGSPTWTVVGVVDDVRRTLEEPPSAAVYVPQAQFGPGFMTVHIKARAGAGAVLAAAQRELAALDPNVVPTNVRTVREDIRADAAPTRFYLMLVGLFAVLAVLLSAVGLYGVVAYLVSRRTREIGVRIALGARRGEVTGLVFRQAAAPAAGGIVAGLVIAFWGGRLMKSMLFQVEAADPVVFVGVTAMVLGVCALAVLVPARRATRVDPVSALRVD